MVTTLPGTSRSPCKVGSDACGPFEGCRAEQTDPNLQCRHLQAGNRHQKREPRRKRGRTLWRGPARCDKTYCVGQQALCVSSCCCLNSGAAMAAGRCPQALLPVSHAKKHIIVPSCRSSLHWLPPKNRAGNWPPLTCRCRFNSIALPAAAVSTPVVSEARGNATAATLHVYLANASPTNSMYISAFSDNQGTTAVGSAVAVTTLVGSGGAGDAGTQSNPWALQRRHPCAAVLQSGGGGRWSARRGIRPGWPGGAG